MTFEQFREKLIPFFTPEQIGHLDTEAIVSALDAHEGTEIPNDMSKAEYFRTLHYMGRDVICNLIADCIETEPAFIEKLAGSPISWERRKALIKQMDIEW